MNKNIKPLFMWAGGKTKMIKHYQSYLPKTFNTYIEPFFGGGSMLLVAHKINPKANIIINDSNHSIIKIYKSIKSDVVSFTSKLDDLTLNYLPLSKEERKKYYYNLRNDHAYNHSAWSATEESATLYFLMKTGFNGIWQINKNTNDRFGTPAGLLNQKDNIYDKENIKNWHNLLQQATILAGDYKQTNSYVTDNSWLFMDPPYRGGFTKYATSFNDQNQKEVIDFAYDCSCKGSQSWSTNRDLDDNFFEDYISLKGYAMNIYKFGVTYTAGRRKQTVDGFEAKKAKEYLIIKKGNNNDNS